MPINLGTGENAIISLAEENNNKTIFTDDEAAIKRALSYGLEPYRIFRLLILAKEAGLIDSVKSVIEKMKIAGEGIRD